RNWGVGDFGDLRTLVELAAARGAAGVGVNPLHATLGGPYSPSSRHALNFAYLDIEAIPEFAKSRAAQKLVATTAFQRMLARLREAELVDYVGVAKAKLEVLELLFKETKRRPAPSSFALYEALRERFGYGWEGWPTEYHDPASAAVRSFARKNAHRVAFYEYIQRAARAQLDAV